ncbi:MAG TPA: GtrA family protein [Gammaproteobacteria bacterium]|nr:GtrA family protein [Gammaproteobacteria bacterium]
MTAIKYILFAVISTLLNLLFQYLSFLIYTGIGKLFVAMVAGTLAGLVSKYVLDKKYIFYHTPENRRDDAKKFVLYTFMGVFTTAIFWGTEIGFDALFDHEYAKYAGAVIGLGIGYIIKYSLDKKYVFVERFS